MIHRRSPSITCLPMKPRLLLIPLLMLFFGFGCASNMERREVHWEPVPKGMILTRNFMVPKSPESEGYKLAPSKFRLGSKAFAKKPPRWWREIANKSKLDGENYLEIFPLAYAGEFVSSGGHRHLLVVQVSHSFSGDGYLSPGPELHFIARVFQTDATAVHLVAEAKQSLGSFQYSRLFSGEANAGQVSFRADTGTSFDGHDIARTRYYLLTITPDGLPSFKERDSGE